MTKTKRAPARGKRMSVRAKSTANSKAKSKARARANSLTKPLPKPQGNRLVFAPELMADGKRRYETTLESLESIALDFSGNRTTLRNIAKRENWVRYVPPPIDFSRAADIAAKAAALEAEAHTPNLPSLRFGEASADPPIATLAAEEDTSAAPPGTDWSMRERIDALRGAVDEEIAAVRALRASLKGVPHSTETASRTSRTLADLTTTLERLHRLEIGASQHKGQDAHADRLSETPADTDAFCEALAQKIEKFLASRTDADAFADDDAEREAGAE